MTQLDESGTTVITTRSLWTLNRQFVTSAQQASTEPLSSFENSASVFFVLRNGPDSVYRGYNATVFLIEAHTKAMVFGFSSAILALLIASVLIVLATLFGLVVPTLYRLRQLQSSMLQLLVHLPFSTVQSFFVKSYQVAPRVVCAAHSRFAAPTGTARRGGRCRGHGNTRCHFW